MKRIHIVLIVLFSLSFGISAGVALWFAGSWSGSSSTNALVFYQTQEFKDAVLSGKPFRLGEYKFFPKTQSIIVEYRADKDVDARRHAEKAKRNFLKRMGE